MLNNKENNLIKKASRHRFVIGIGSQRAGSTLLHRLLSASTNIFMHPLKELHYFDTLYGYRPASALKDFSQRQINREINKIVEAKDFKFIDKKYRCYLRTNNILSNKKIENIDYLDLFRPCLAPSEMLGEVTPEYMLLNDASIEKMKNIIGVDASIILICRNPVKRFLSAVKLMNKYNDMNMDSDTANVWLRRMIDEDSSWLKAQDGYNDYAGTIDRYSKHFSQFAVISYDQMVTEPVQVAKKLADELNIDINFEIFVQESTKLTNDLGDGFDLSVTNHEFLSDRYRENQQYLNEYFGCEISK